MIGWAYAFPSRRRTHVVFFLVNGELTTVNFSSGSPADRTQRDPRIRRIWATSPRLPIVDVRSANDSCGYRYDHSVIDDISPMLLSVPRH